MASHVETVIDVEQIQDVGSVNKLFHDVLAQERRIQVLHYANFFTSTCTYCEKSRTALVCMFTARFHPTVGRFFIHQH